MKKIIALILVIVLCAGFTACSLSEKDNQTSSTMSTSSTSSTSSTTETTLATTADIAYVSSINVSVTSDINDTSFCPYEFLNSTHTNINGFWYRGTGRESTVNLAEIVSLMPYMKVKSGFKINSPEGVNVGKVQLYNTDGTEIENAKDLDSENLTQYISSGKEYIAKFYANKTTVSENGETTNYYIYYLIISLDKAAN